MPSSDEEIVVVFMDPFVGNGFTNKDSGGGIRPRAPSGGETGIDWS